MKLQKFWLSPPELLDIQREAKSWEAIGAWAPGGQNVGTESEPLRVTSAAITRSLIDVLGVQPERGRNFTEEEDRVGGPSVAIISHAAGGLLLGLLVAFPNPVDLVGLRIPAVGDVAERAILAERHGHKIHRLIKFPFSQSFEYLKIFKCSLGLRTLRDRSSFSATHQRY